MQWTEDELAGLPVNKGFRLRGLDMTRLETFCDAAFAFAVTMLVISGSGIPGSTAELAAALKGIPAFAASFAAVASLWIAHRRWSRRFGLEDGWTTTITLGLVFVMLVYVYPLKMVFSAMFHWMSAGRLPSDFVLSEPRDLLNLFVIYGLGFGAISGLLVLLNYRALRLAADLRLDEVEKMLTRQDMAMHLTLSVTALASAAFAAFVPGQAAAYAGFVYMTLNISMPIVATRFAGRVKRLKTEKSDEEQAD